MVQVIKALDMMAQFCELCPKISTSLEKLAPSTFLQLCTREHICCCVHYGEIVRLWGAERNYFWDWARAVFTLTARKEPTLIILIENQRFFGCVSIYPLRRRRKVLKIDFAYFGKADFYPFSIWPKVGLVERSSPCEMRYIWCIFNSNLRLKGNCKGFVRLTS